MDFRRQFPSFLSIFGAFEFSEGCSQFWGPCRQSLLSLGRPHNNNSNNNNNNNDNNNNNNNNNISDLYNAKI